MFLKIITNGEINEREKSKTKSIIRKTAAIGTKYLKNRNITKIIIKSTELAIGSKKIMIFTRSIKTILT